MPFGLSKRQKSRHMTAAQSGRALAEDFGTGARYEIPAFGNRRNGTATLQRADFDGTGGISCVGSRTGAVLGWRRFT